MSSYRCVIVAEGDIERVVHEFPSQEELEAFRIGVSIGANLYGAGSCQTYTLEEVIEDQLTTRNLTKAQAHDIHTALLRE